MGTNDLSFVGIKYSKYRAAHLFYRYRQQLGRHATDRNEAHKFEYRAAHLLYRYRQQPGRHATDRNEAHKLS